MSAARTQRIARGRSNKSRARRRRTTIGGLAVVFVLVVVALVVAYAVIDSKPKPLPQSDIAPISSALLHVPAADVTGVDPSVPRPAGSVRAYWRRSGNLVTVIYSRKGGYEDVLSQLQRDLAAQGWVPPADRKPGRAPGQSQSWSYVYQREGQVAQVTVISVGGVTSTTYIVQTRQ